MSYAENPQSRHPGGRLWDAVLPATKATPKEMLPIVDKPTIQYIVEEALQSGIEEILIISGHANGPLKTILIRISP